MSKEDLDPLAGLDPEQRKVIEAALGATSGMYDEAERELIALAQQHTERIIAGVRNVQGIGGVQPDAAAGLLMMASWKAFCQVGRPHRARNLLKQLWDNLMAGIEEMEKVNADRTHAN